MSHLLLCQELGEAGGRREHCRRCWVPGRVRPAVSFSHAAHGWTPCCFDGAPLCWAPHPFPGSLLARCLSGLDKVRLLGDTGRPVVSWVSPRGPQTPAQGVAEVSQPTLRLGHKETEDQRGEVTRSRSHSSSATGPETYGLLVHHQGSLLSLWLKLWPFETDTFIHSSVMEVNKASL